MTLAHPALAKVMHVHILGNVYPLVRGQDNEGILSRCTYHMIDWIQSLNVVRSNVLRAFNVALEHNCLVSPGINHEI